MDPQKYAGYLEWQIAALDAEMKAYQPDWATPSLAEAYSDALALDAVIGVFDDQIDGLHAAHQKALADHQYGQQKIQHLYL